MVDLVVEGGRLLALGPGAARAAGAAEQRMAVRDGQGLVLLPGLVELHAHLEDPGREYREDLQSGLSAAAAGGFTRVCAQPDTAPVNDNRAITESMLARASRVGRGHLHPLAAATLGLKGTQLAEIGDQLEAGAQAVSSGRGFVPDAAVMRRLLEYCHTFDTVLMQHPQDPTLTAGGVMHEGARSVQLGLRGWPRAAESIALFRDLALAASTGGRYHASTLSTAEAVAELARAKQGNARVSADVSPHHLLLDHDSIGEYDTRYRVDPPLRESRDREALISALESGVIDCISSDHRPRSALETQGEFDESAPGFSGLEFCLSLVWELVKGGKLSAGRAVAALTTGPANVLGLPTPRLEVGAAANFVLFDPTTPWTPTPSDLLSKGTNSPFVGKSLVGRTLLTACEGKAIFERPHPANTRSPKDSE